jgi:ribonuclease E
MTRRIRREDPAYLAAMREAKVLFEAEMAKSAMKGRGRPAKTATVAEPIADDVDLSDVALEIVSVADDESAEEEKDEEKAEEEAEEDEEDVAPVKKPAKASAKKAPKKVVAKKEKAPLARRPSKPAARKR